MDIRRDLCCSVQGPCTVFGSKLVMEQSLQDWIQGVALNKSVSDLTRSRNSVYHLSFYRSKLQETRGFVRFRLRETRGWGGCCSVNRAIRVDCDLPFPGHMPGVRGFAVLNQYPVCRNCLSLVRLKSGKREKGESFSFGIMKGLGC